MRRGQSLRNRIPDLVSSTVSVAEPALHRGPLIMQTPVLTSIDAGGWQFREPFVENHTLSRRSAKEIL
jgi:hypothetical protein